MLAGSKITPIAAQCPEPKEVLALTSPTPLWACGNYKYIDLVRSDRKSKLFRGEEKSQNEKESVCSVDRARACRARGIRVRFGNACSADLGACRVVIEFSGEIVERGIFVGIVEFRCR